MKEVFPDRIVADIFFDGIESLEFLTIPPLEIR